MNFMGICGGLMGSFMGLFMGFNGIYPLVNCSITMENHHAIFMGKLTISMAIFNSELSVITRRYTFFQGVPLTNSQHFRACTLW